MVAVLSSPTSPKQSGKTNIPLALKSRMSRKQKCPFLKIAINFRAGQIRQSDQECVPPWHSTSGNGRLSATVISASYQALWVLSTHSKSLRCPNMQLIPQFRAKATTKVPGEVRNLAFLDS